MREVIKLDAKKILPVQRKRVAAYVRVSSGKDAQLHSLSAQISYYNNYIGSRGDWELAGIYADEAMTGTKDNRPEFQKMLADCRAGKIDMVIAKSITRLARNTVTLLETARGLKALGIDVYFEKENIHTLSTDGELMLTLLASFAQEESRSVSENMKWRIKKKFEQGYSTYIDMYGYRFLDNTLQVVPEEARVIQQIFADYLSGMGKAAIAKKLNRQNIPAKSGNLWRGATVRNILANEKYTGDLLLQKFYRLDHISKKNARNHGERPMYHVSDCHEAIIDKVTFAKVQEEIRRRKSRATQSEAHHGGYLFTGFIRCGQCGRKFCRRISNRNTKYAKPVWTCSLFNEIGKSACLSKQIPEEILIAKTTEALGFSDWNREDLCQQIKEIKAMKNNTLVYEFWDGRTEEIHWQNRSRRESWTEEMKQRAREREMERQKKIKEEGR